MQWRKSIGILIVVAVIAGAGTILLWRVSHDVYVVEVPLTATPADCDASPRGDGLRAAIIGDYGLAGQPEAAVAALVDRWAVDSIVTVGDNNYPDGTAATIDANIGQYYHDFIAPYQGAYGAGAAENRFFPALGNHDWRADGAAPYLAYFTLPGNERYYAVRRGPVEFFIVDSDEHEPDGIRADSAQAQWLQAQLAASAASWKVVVMHHTPYTSALWRRPDPTLQWPFAAWGANVVLAGHDHFYERLSVENFPYIVNGAGGKELYPFGAPEPDSVVRYNQDYGAQLLNATAQCLNLSFYSRAGALIDSVTLRQ